MKDKEFGEVLNVKEASEFLQISRQTIVTEIEKSGLPARKIGREWRFSKCALLEWLGNSQPTKEVKKD